MRFAVELKGQEHFCVDSFCLKSLCSVELIFANYLETLREAGSMYSFGTGWSSCKRGGEMAATKTSRYISDIFAIIP